MGRVGSGQHVSMLDGDGWLGVFNVFRVLNALNVVLFERMISYVK